MATFKFGRRINIHWNGYDIVGPADTVFSIPDQLYEEFNADISGVEPTLQWIDTNEFQTLKDSVPTGGYVAKVIGTSPVSISSTSNTSTISISSGTAGNGYLLVADGTGGTIWNPASTSGLTSVVGISPISSVVSGGTVSVSINTTGFQSAGSYQPAGSYQTAGNYASSASGTSPISATLSTAGVLSVSIDATATSAENAARTRTKVRNSTASTITKGSVVYIVGSSGTVPTIEKALANADATSSRTFGIVEENITSNTDGYVTNQGLLTGLDTSAAGIVDGAVLWLSPTIAGAYTTTKPAGPNHGVLVGIVVKGQTAGAGSIYVLIKNGAELDEIHDVNISALANGQALIYSSTASVWQNQVLPVASVSATSPIAATTTTSTGAVSLSITTGSINSTHLSANSVGASQIIDASIGSAELADNAVVAAKINAGAVDTSKISSGAAANNTVLTANGSGAASFLSIASSDFVKISTTTITAATQTISVTSIPQTYTHLFVVVHGVKSSTATGADLQITVNASTAATYTYEGVATNGGSISYGTSATTTVDFNKGTNTRTAVLANTKTGATSLHIFIPNYTATSIAKYGEAKIYLGDYAGPNIGFLTWSNNSTSAITSVQVKSSSATNLLATSTVVELYGIK
jgi:hypothetical protein